MYCTKNVADGLVWVGGDDRRLAMFEGVYSVPAGVSYNSYLLLDQKTALMDTVDKAVSRVFFENLEHALGGRELDYLVIQHMEPDHSASIEGVLARHPGVTVVCNAMIKTMLEQFFSLKPEKLLVVKEGDSLSLGRRTLNFVMAPMVHWPEVMVSFESADGVLFSADAFGSFGALGGAIYADQLDFMDRWLDEARRYYCNIVGKYGPQVQALLAKAAKLPIKMLCPLHGPVHRGEDVGRFIEKYLLWSSYTPEDSEVLIAYASVYGNTENAAAILASRLFDRGVPAKVYDVSVTPASEILSEAFRLSHLVFASTTYNAGVFITMEELLRDLAAHNLQNRTIAFMENGSWAPASGKLMREIMAPLKNMRVLEQTLSIKSALKEDQLQQIDALADAIAADFSASSAAAGAPAGELDPSALFSISYGLFLLTSRVGEQSAGCIVNTACQLTSSPLQLSVAVNKQNQTHDFIMKSGVFNLSVLTESAPFSFFEAFGYRSGRDADKFSGRDMPASANGLLYEPQVANALISARVVKTVDCGTHTLFIAEVTEARRLSDAPSATYSYYFANIKPAAPKKKKGYVCSICGYVYEGDTLPEDFVCPICKHGAEAFQRME